MQTVHGWRRTVGQIANIVMLAPHNTRSDRDIPMEVPLGHNIRQRDPRLKSDVNVSGASFLNAPCPQC